MKRASDPKHSWWMIITEGPKETNAANKTNIPEEPKRN